MSENWHTQRRIIWCDCGLHAFVLEPDEHPDGGLASVDVTLWGNDSGTLLRGRFPLRLRFRWAWHALRHGQAPTEWVVMKKEDVMQLRDVCGDMLEKWNG